MRYAIIIFEWYIELKDEYILQMVIENYEDIANGSFHITFRISYRRLISRLL